jgi:hypothetical protein
MIIGQPEPQFFFGHAAHLPPSLHKMHPQTSTSRRFNVVMTLLTFRKNYFLLFVLLFIVEVLIALYLHDRIIRPYIGDYLVVIMLYCFVRAFIKTSVLPAALAVLLFAYLIEVLQYFQIVSLLGLENNRVAKTVIGYQFEWIDMLAYTLGIITVLLLERMRRRQASSSQG